MAYKFGWFSTGRDEAACELLTAVHESIREGFIQGEIGFVFCSRERGEKPESDAFMDLVEDYGCELVCFSSKKFKPGLWDAGRTDAEKLKQWRREYDTEVVERLSGLRHDLDVLAGYMLIVSNVLCERFDMINLHPATPTGPKGAWQEVIWELISTGARETGVMMHLVTTELDRGPPITYCRFPIRGGAFEDPWSSLSKKLETKTLKEIEQAEGEDEPYFKLVRQEGVKRELPLIIQTLKSFADGTLHIKSGSVFEGDSKIEGGYDLSNQIASILKN